MDNKTSQFYIVSLDNGIREEEPITIDVINSFSDGSSLVQLNNTVFGLYKNSSTRPETLYIDDCDIIRSDIAELLDVDHEVTKRIVTNDANAGVFVPLNYSKDIETRISASTILNHVVEYLNKGMISGVEGDNLRNSLKYSINNKGNAIKDENEIAKLIDLGINAIAKEIQIQKNTSLSKKSLDAITKNYLRMIIFDLIVGRKHRGLDYYLISKINTQGKPEWLDAYFAPISVSTNYEKEKTVGEGEYVLNNIYVDQTALLNVLFNRYYNKIKKITESLNDAKKLYLDAMVRIIYNNIDLKEASKLEEKIVNNFNRITDLQKEHEKVLTKEEKTNKVERTMATQSLNVRVTTKLDLIQKKYPINPKDHPELLKKQKDVKKEDLKLIVENNNKGFALASILLSIIGLACGAACSIAYVLLIIGR
jgi:GTPase SAR1 family protein